MVDTKAVHGWKRRLQVPVAVSTGWFLLYTTLGVFGFALGGEGSSVRYLFSTTHLSQPLGWLFLASLVGTLVGVVVYGYAFVAGH